MGSLVIGLLLFAFGTALGLASGFVGGHSYTKRNLRYRDPHLHEGPFGQPYREHHATVWRRTLATSAVVDISPEHRHQVDTCTVTDSLAHVDVCYCGQKRYGVFGSWS